MSVTSAYMECTTGKWYHLIVLADGFLLGYRYWTFAKTSASALRKMFLMFSITTAGCMTGVFSATCAAYEEIVRASCCTVSGQSSVVRTLAPQVKGSGFESR